MQIVLSAVIKLMHVTRTLLIRSHITLANSTTTCANTARLDVRLDHLAYSVNNKHTKLH